MALFNWSLFYTIAHASITYSRMRWCAAAQKPYLYVFLQICACVTSHMRTDSTLGATFNWRNDALCVYASYTPFYKTAHASLRTCALALSRRYFQRISRCVCASVLCLAGVYSLLYSIRIMVMCNLFVVLRTFEIYIIYYCLKTSVYSILYVYRCNVNVVFCTVFSCDF